MAWHGAWMVPTWERGWGALAWTCPCWCYLLLASLHWAMLIFTTVNCCSVLGSPQPYWCQGGPICVWDSCSAKYLYPTDEFSTLVVVVAALENDPFDWQQGEDNNWPMSGWLKINPACYPLPHINLEKQGLPNPNVTSASLGTNCCLAFSAALIQELVVFWALSSALLSVFMFLVLCTVFSEWCTLMLLTCSQTFKWLLNGL